MRGIKGLYNNWLDAKKSSNKDYAEMPITMGHYTREDLPFYYALADAFTVCDQSYCGALTSTTPNRSLFWTGTLRDKQSTDSRVYMRNDELFRGRLSWKTFPERLWTRASRGSYAENSIRPSKPHLRANEARTSKSLLISMRLPQCP